MPERGSAGQLPEIVHPTEGFRPYLRQALAPQVGLPDIITFAESGEFLALPTPLYPKQRTILRLIFLETDRMTEFDRKTIDEWRAGMLRPEGERFGVPHDVWDRVEWCKQEGYDHFRLVEFIGGRRGGKGHLGAIIAARQMYRLLALGNPQSHYGIDPRKDLRCSSLRPPSRKRGRTNSATLWGWSRVPRASRARSQRPASTRCRFSRARSPRFRRWRSAPTPRGQGGPRASCRYSTSSPIT